MNRYIALTPGTLEIVDRFYGTETSLEERGNGREYVIVPEDIEDCGCMTITRNENTNEIEFANDFAKLEAKKQNLIKSNFAILRSMRNAILASTDWINAPDVSMSEEKKQAWFAYRQALRDLPANTEDPENPNWPTPPQ